MPPDDVHSAPTVAIVLAAGAGSRFLAPVHKLAAVIAGRAILEHVLSAATGACIGEVLVVTGEHPLATLVPGAPPGVTEIRHEAWRAGLASSLQAGIAAARSRSATAVVVGLGDQPWVRAEAWRAVATGSSAIAVARYGERRGHPVRLAAEVWSLLPSEGEHGARVVMERHPALVVDVPCVGSPSDVDVVADLPGAATGAGTGLTRDPGDDIVGLRES